MSGFFDRLRAQRPKTSVEPEAASSSTKAIPDNLWVKCSRCGATVYRKVFEEQLKVCDKCGHHHKLTAWERVRTLADEGSFEEWADDIKSGDPLGFGGDYLKKLADDRSKTRLSDAVLTGAARLDDRAVALGVMDFHFRGGSMGSVVGEKITRLMETALERSLPTIVVTSSGGARMQEGIYSLMQMAKTSAARNRLLEARLPYLVVLTDPTTAGVAASFAALGDVIVAEPNAIIGFSGARVIEQTIRQKLPEGFQTAEFYLEHGFIDRVVPRREMKSTLTRLLGFLGTRPPVSAGNSSRKRRSS
jgi:acetyl-CoA carboxylase carboxyl transferase subunit beta